MFLTTMVTKVLSWFDSNTVKTTDNVGEAIDWLRVIPFILMHMFACWFLLVGWESCGIVGGTVFVSYSYVCHHRFLSSLFLPQSL